MTVGFIKRRNLGTETDTQREDDGKGPREKMAIDTARERDLEHIFPSQPSEGTNP